MANRPANAGAHSAGPQQGTQQGPAAAPPPVHHQDYPRSRRAAAAKAAKASKASKATSQIVAWLPYLIVLAGTVAGLLASRSKAQDVAGFAVFGAAVLAVAASLP